MIVSGEGLTQSRGKKVVFQGLDMEIEAGSTALLGPNGAGKTTLLETIVTLLRPRGGKLTVFGMDVSRPADVTEVRRLVGFLPQHFEAAKNFTARDMVAYAGWTKGIQSRHLDVAAQEALDLVDLTERREHKVGSLSGGMLQRLGIACSVVHRPRLLVLDEPTVGLDPAQRSTFRQLIRNLSATTSVLLSTHITDDVSASCQSVVLLDAGRILYQGSTAELSLIGSRRNSDNGYESDSELERGYLRVLQGKR